MIYLASPYSSPDAAIVHRRYELVREATAYFISRGFVVFSPIVHSHHLGLPGDMDFWRDYDLAMLEQAEELWILAIDGWKDSVGVTEERWFAESHRKAIYAVTPGETSAEPFERQELNRYLRGHTS